VVSEHSLGPKVRPYAIPRSYYQSNYQASGPKQISATKKLHIGVLTFDWPTGLQNLSSPSEIILRSYSYYWESFGRAELFRSEASID